MITGLSIENFRSIQKDHIELAPITLVYGANGSGKSSLLYAPLVFKNLTLTPNQPPDAFFQLGFANLGGFKQGVFDHREDAFIKLGITLNEGESLNEYSISLGLKTSEFTLWVSGQWHLKMSLPVTFPYPANQQVEAKLNVGENEYGVRWNGLAVTQVTPLQPTPETQAEAQKINISLNRSTEALRRVDFVPLRRGFSQPQYTPVGVSPTPVTEAEVATLLANDQYLRERVANYLELITNRAFSIHVPLGTANFYLNTRDRATGVAVELVNDGFGINQLVFLLAKALRHDTDLLCVEEPEIHLHPTSVRKLVQAMVHMTKAEGKKFLISTHSESLVLALLSQVAATEIRPEDVACYLAVKSKKATSFERQMVHENGQIDGGLGPFMEAELEDLKAFFGVKA